MSKPIRIKRGEGYNLKPATAKRPSTPTPHPSHKRPQRFKLIYIDFSDDTAYKWHNQVQAIESGDQEVTLYFVKEETPLSEVWGDDWDDTPANCNAGPPYKYDLALKFKLGGSYEIPSSKQSK